MWFDCTKIDFFKETENCLQQQFARWFMRLPWRNSASEFKRNVCEFKHLFI